jgi:hypothetical protein
MQRLMAVVGVVIALGAATAMHGQSQQRRRIVGGPESAGEGFRMNGRTRMTTATATLRFTGNDGRPWYSIDFVTSYEGVGDRPTSPPSVVDMIVTEHPANEDAPEMTMRLNGEPLPLATRLYSRRSVASTIPLEELLRMTNADAIVEQAFDTELEFSAQQLGSLRVRVQTWAGRR